MSDIWFDLCLGNIAVDDSGVYHFRPKFTRLSRLTAGDVASIEPYRSHLHRLLDKAIDDIEARMQRQSGE